MMHTLRHEKLLASLAVAMGALVATAPAVLAGSRTNWSTPFVNTTYRLAMGQLADTRYSSDPTSYIGCEVYNYGAQSTLYCYANDPSYNYGNCYTTNPDMVQIGLSVTGDSVVSFTWDAQGTCTSVAVHKSSAFSGKVY